MVRFKFREMFYFWDFNLVLKIISNWNISFWVNVLFFVKHSFSFLLFIITLYLFFIAIFF